MVWWARCVRRLTEVGRPTLLVKSTETLLSEKSPFPGELLWPYLGGGRLGMGMLCAITWEKPLESGAWPEPTSPSMSIGGENCGLSTLLHVGLPNTCLILPKRENSSSLLPPDCYELTHGFILQAGMMSCYFKGNLTVDIWCPLMPSVRNENYPIVSCALYTSLSAC